MTALINQDVGISVFDLALLNDHLLHSSIVFMLSDSLIKFRVNATKTLCRDLFRIEVGYVFVVEREPITFTRVSLFNEAVVMPLFSGALMYYYTY